MTIAAIERCFKRFLTTDQAVVLAISGKWDLGQRVRLQFRELSDGSDKNERIGANVEEALRIIGRKSKINEIRVLRKYGISIDDRSGED